MFANNRSIYKHSKQIVGIEHCSDLRFRKLDCCTGSVCFNHSLKMKLVISETVLSKQSTCTER